MTHSKPLELGPPELQRHHRVELGEDPNYDQAGLRVARVTTQRTIDRLLLRGVLSRELHGYAEILYRDWYRSAAGGHSPRSSCVLVTSPSQPEISDGAVAARARVSEAFGVIPKRHSSLVVEVVLYDAPVGKRAGDLIEALTILGRHYGGRPRGGVED